jgi:hypothetical protein
MTAEFAREAVFRFPAFSVMYRKKVTYIIMFAPCILPRTVGSLPWRKGVARQIRRPTLQLDLSPALTKESP